MERYDLDPKERSAKAEHGASSQPGLIPIKITPEQVKAMAHAAEADEAVAVSLCELTEAQLDAQVKLDRTLVIDSYDDEGWLLVNYVWNKGGCGTWLATDGGWHYQPGESGYYPWKEEANGTA